MEILKGVLKKSLLVIAPFIVAAFFLEGKRLPLGIFLGWIMGILNFRQLARNVEGLVGADRATAKLLFLNMGRLLAMFAAIFLVVYYKIVNIFGLLFGFTVVFVLVLIEGARQGRSGSAGQDRNL